MTRFDPKQPWGKYPGAAAMKPQYVLITENGEERTSNVTEARILKAVYEINANEYVTLEKCLPVTLVQHAAAFAISFYKDSCIAVYFRVRKRVLRMRKNGFKSEDAADMMCNFFRSAGLPDMSDWTCEELKPTPHKSETTLAVDGQDFKYFGCADVAAALENIIEGKSRWLFHDFTGENGGYINIRRCGNSDEPPKYKVELVKWTEPTPTGYRTVISDVALLRRWLWDFATDHKYPDPTPEWKSFDVEDVFQRLIFKYLDEDER